MWWEAGFPENSKEKFIIVAFVDLFCFDVFNLKSYLNQDNKSYMDQKDSQSNYPTIKDFVLQEALEKAFEINVLGLKDF